MSNSSISRSFVIPVLDFSPHSSYNINTLLEDLKSVDGEVICIFNSHEVFDNLRSHERIDKYCFNSQNAGVSRSWNIGINMSENDAVFILNADLHVKPRAIEKLLDYLFKLDSAVIVGPQGSMVDFKNLKDEQYHKMGTFQQPIRVHAVSGFFFCIHRERYLKHKLVFDVQFSPCFMEEWDMGLQIIEAGLASYAVPVLDCDHEWGITSSAGGNTPLQYFGRTVYRDRVILDNRKKFVNKWFGVEL